MSKVDFCSFRDPAGVVLKHRGRILRLIKHQHSEEIQTLIKSPLFSDLVESHSLPKSQCLSQSEFQSLANELPPIPHVDLQKYNSCIEHEAVPFPSYPYEWAPEMLHAAGQFTLDLAEKLLQQNLGLKDASPYNILFCGPNPIFVDILSIERRDSYDPMWLPYAQFVRTFLLPLIAYNECSLSPNQILLHRTDGIETEELHHLLTVRKLCKPGILQLVTLPTLLSRKKKNAFESRIYQKKKVKPELAKFILERMLKGLKRHLQRFVPKTKSSPWTDYFSVGESYNKEEFGLKSSIMTRLLQNMPKTVLDIGCNTGFFSILAAKQGASVVAIDSDPVVVGALWREAQHNQYPILPLVVDICRPTPAVGWKNAENLSFLQRAQGSFDAVMMLAVLHHMTITARIPLEDVAHLCAMLTTKHLIIEFVAPDDPQFRKLLRGRDELYKHLTKEFFEKVFQRHFRIENCERIGSTSRWIYHLQRDVKKN